MPQANIYQINSALIKIKDSINNPKRGNFVLAKRAKNEKTLIKLGFLQKHVNNEILNLTYENYCFGPEPNISPEGERKGAVWTFGKFIKGIEIYIKIQIIPVRNKYNCICISFHEAEKKMKYPYAKG